MCLELGYKQIEKGGIIKDNSLKYILGNGNEETLTVFFDFQGNYLKLKIKA